MDLELKNKIIVVTGGAKGVGLGVVQVLVKEGAIPVIIGRSQSDNETVVNEIKKAGGAASQFEAELTDPKQCQAAVASVLQKYNRIDGLVNNAGVNDGVGLEDGSYDAFVTSLHRNLIHYYMMAHYALP